MAESFLPPVVAVLTANTGQFTAKMGEARAEMSATTEHGSRTFGALAGVAKAAVVGVGVAAVGVGAVSLKMAGDFQESMTLLVTGAGESRDNLKMVADGILAMAPKVGESTKRLADGMFLIESAGYHGADGLKVLQAAAEGARVGHADLAAVANAATTVMHDFGIGADDASTAVNFLVGTTMNGKMHLDDLVSSLGTIAPLASQLHVPLADIGGAMSTMTVAGIDADRAATYLRFTLGALINPTHKAQGALQEIGLSSTDLGTTLSTKGLLPALQLLQDRLATVYGQGSPKYIAAMADIVGGTRGLQGVLGTTGNNLQTFIDNTAKVTSQMAGAKGEVIGWRDVQQDFNFKLDVFRQYAETAAIRLGMWLIPQIEGLGRAWGQMSDAFNRGGMGAVVDLVVKKFQDAWPGIQAALAKIATALGNWIQENGPKIADQLGAWGKAFVEWIGPRIPPMLQELGKLLGKALDWLGETGLPALIKKLEELSLAFVKWIGPAIPPMMLELAKLYAALAKWLVTDAVPTWAKDMLKMTAELWLWIAKAIPQLLVELGKLYVTVGNWVVTDALPKLVKDLGKWAKAFVDWVADAVQKLPGQLAELLKTLLDFVGKIPGKIVDALGDASKLLINWGKDLIKGAVDGIKSNAGGIVDALSAAVPGGSLVTGLIKDPNPLHHLPWGAQGGLITRPMIIGAGEDGPELLLPLSKPSRAQQLLGQAGITGSGGGGSGFLYSPSYAVTVAGDVSQQTRDEMRRMFDQHDRELMATLSAYGSY